MTDEAVLLRTDISTGGIRKITRIFGVVGILWATGSLGSAEMESAIWAAVSGQGESETTVATVSGHASVPESNETSSERHKSSIGETALEKAPPYATQFIVSGVYSPRDEVDASVVFSARLSSNEYHADGSRNVIDYGTVQVENGRFSIEAHVQEPKVAKLEISDGDGNYAVARHYLVIEPQVEISVERRSQIDGMFVATSNGGRHARLLDSWQFDEEYVSALRAMYVAAWDESRRYEDGSMKLDEDFVELLQRSEGMKEKNLKRLAWESKDPLDSLLALELARGILAPGTLDTNEVIALYDRFAKSLDQDVVARRVTPARNRLNALLQRTANNKKLQPGQQVPELVLVNLNDAKVSLAQVIEENDVVLIDFWAVWCAPCIAAFPPLKELYEEYADDGFEVMSISVNTSIEDWRRISEEHELPWIDLGASGDLLGPTTVSYGVQGLPTTFLVDSDRRILRKNIKPDELKAVLAERYDESTVRN